jgi:hypothetical protein
MTKRQLIEAIQQLNPTAQAPFLGQFTDTELETYLDRLRGIREGRIHLHSRAAHPDEQLRVAS